MKKIKRIFISLFVLTIFCITSSIYGVTTIKTNNDNPKPGDTITVTVTTSGAQSWDIHVMASGPVSGNTIGLVGDSGTLLNGTGSASGTFNVTGEGNITFVTTELSNVTTQDGKYGDAYGIKIITSKTPPPPPPPVTPTPNPTPNPTNPPANNTTSKDATLKSLKVGEQGLSPNFRSSTLNYAIAIGPNVENIAVTAVPNDSKASVYVTGNAGLVDGDNKIFITVTAADKKTKKTYTITATKSADPDKANAYLENLIIDNAILVEEFIAENLEYTIESVPYDVDKLEIRAFPKIKDAKLEISGNDSLVEGENIVKVKVIALDGTTTKEYIIKVNKEAKPIEVVGIYEEDSLQDPPSKFRVILDTLWAYLKEFWLVLALFAACLIELWEIIHLYKKVKTLEGPKVRLDNVEEDLETNKPRRRGNAVENVSDVINSEEVIENIDNGEDNMQEGVVEDISDELVDDTEEVAQDEEDITDNFEDIIDDEDDK